jgi:hypothetical protein
VQLTTRAVGLVDDDPVFHLGGPGGGVRLEVLASGASLRVWGASEAMAEMLHLALTEATRASGLLPLHASVAERDGLATAFLGPSGRGKTTTLLRAVIEGWRPVAEDFCWLDPDTLDLHGWDGGLRLLPDSRALLESHYPGVRAEATADEKVLVPYERLGLERRPARLARIARLERDPARAARPSAWAGLGRREAAVALWEATGVPLAAASRERAGAAVGLVLGRVELATLELGAPPLPL